METSVFQLADILYANLRSMSQASSLLHQLYPSTGGTDSDNQSSFEIWSRSGFPDDPKEIYQVPTPQQLEENPSIFASAILEEVCRLLFPTRDRIVDIDVVLRKEGKSCEFCIVGTMNSEKLGLLIENLESKRLLLNQKSGEEYNPNMP